MILFYSGIYQIGPYKYAYLLRAVAKYDEKDYSKYGGEQVQFVVNVPLAKQLYSVT